MSCNLEEKIAERTKELKDAVEEYNAAANTLNVAKEKVLTLQGRLTELQTLKTDHPDE
tara:strand:+ start:531 stop:704 length:174 start_codon:yes stop_codon:yes gene_type:complete